MVHLGNVLGNIGELYIAGEFQKLIGFPSTFVFFKTKKIK